MKALLPFALGALVLGCAPPASNSAPTPNAPGASVTNGEAANAPANSGGSNKGGSNNGSSAAVERTSDDSRVYPRKELKVATVKLKGKPFRLWIMDTGGKRQEGMMFLRDKDVKPDQGMLFAFAEVQQKSEANGFWMRNTYIPLDIIYISPKGKVVNVGKGVPFNETSVPPLGSYQYVIELKAGMAKKIGLKPGTLVQLPKNLKPTPD